MEKYIFKRLDKSEITDELFSQIVAVEQSDGGDCYTEEQLREIWINDLKDDNFVCMLDDKIIAHLSFNPKSKRRNDSIYMINLMVMPNYRRRGIAQNLICTATNYYKEKAPLEKIMSLSVDKDNIPAVSLYKKVGYIIQNPICEIDEDDEQYIMDTTLQTLSDRLNDLLRNE